MLTSLPPLAAVCSRDPERAPAPLGRVAIGPDRTTATFGLATDDGRAFSRRALDGRARRIATQPPEPVQQAPEGDHD